MTKPITPSETHCSPHKFRCPFDWIKLPCSFGQFFTYLCFVKDCSLNWEKVYLFPESPTFWDMSWKSLGLFLTSYFYRNAFLPDNGRNFMTLLPTGIQKRRDTGTFPKSRGIPLCMGAFNQVEFDTGNLIQMLIHEPSEISESCSSLCLWLNHSSHQILNIYSPQIKQLLSLFLQVLRENVIWINTKFPKIKVLFQRNE